MTAIRGAGDPLEPASALRRDDQWGSADPAFSEGSRRHGEASWRRRFAIVLGVWVSLVGPAADSLIPTRIESNGGATVDVTYPPAKEVALRFAGGPVAVYEGTVTLAVRIDGAGASVKPSLQACNDRLCLLPETVRLFR